MRTKTKTVTQITHINESESATLRDLKPGIVFQVDNAPGFTCFRTWWVVLHRIECDGTKGVQAMRLPGGTIRAPLCPPGEISPFYFTETDYEVTIIDPPGYYHTQVSHYNDCQANDAKRDGKAGY